MNFIRRRLPEIVGLAAVLFVTIPTLLVGLACPRTLETWLTTGFLLAITDWGIFVCWRDDVRAMLRPATAAQSPQPLPVAPPPNAPIALVRLSRPGALFFYKIYCNTFCTIVHFLLHNFL